MNLLGWSGYKHGVPLALERRKTIKSCANALGADCSESLLDRKNGAVLECSLNYLGVLSLAAAPIMAAKAGLGLPSRSKSKG